MKRLFAVIVLLLLFAFNLLATDFTKSGGQVLDWTLLDDTATDAPFVESGVGTTFPNELSTTLNIVVAHIDTNDATTEFVTINVQVRYDDPAAGDAEGWRLYKQVKVGGGQATAEALNANSGASQGNPERIEVAATTDWDTGYGEWLFLKDAGTLADSCLVLLEGWADADYYINAWALERDYDSSDVLYDGVEFVNMKLPPGVTNFQVTFHNSNGTANYAVRVDYVSVTAIE